MILRSNAELVKLDLLPKTPIWVTLFATVFFCTYAASKGLSNLGRILEFFGTIIISFFIGISIILWLNGDMLNVQPLFNKDEVGSYFKALPLTFMPFLGVEVLTMMPLTNMNKKAIWYGVGAVIAVGILYILVVMGTYSILGVEDTGNYMNAFLFAIRRVEIEMFQFLKRLDVFAFVMWIFALFCMQTILLYVISEYIGKLFSKSKGKIVLIVLGVVIFIVALIPNNMNTVNTIFMYLTMYFGVVPALLIPSILFIVAKVKKNAEKNI
jgi:spore germination protein